MIVLDASVLIAFLNLADQHHDRSTEIMTAGATGGFGIHQLTLAEVLVGGVRVGRANQLLADLRAVGVVPLDPAPDEPLILAEFRATTGLRMPDCCVLAAALHHTVPLATFDARLRSVAESLGLGVLG
jgi:predicted nucleic acid-binding protein